jgi:HD-GYP domain-containing protein (c-di-GMP phosphodiesterase class II)/HAMP domain-containing protein
MPASRKVTKAFMGMPSFGLRAKIVLLLTLMFGVIAGLTVLLAARDFDQVQRDKAVEFQWAAQWVSSEQQRHLAQAQRLALMVMNQWHRGLPGNTACPAGVVAGSGFDAEFGAFALADPDGTLSCNSISWLTAPTVADSEFFLAALHDPASSVVDETDNHDPLQYTAVLARAMLGADGHVQKVVLVALNFSWVREETRKIDLPAGGHLLLLDSDGIVVAGSANLGNWVDRSIVDTSFYRRSAEASDAVYRGPGFAGEDSIVVVHAFQTAAGIMRVVVDAPRNSLLQPVYRELIANLAVSLGAFLLLWVLGYLGIEKYFLRKIHSIESATQRLAAGDLGVRIGWTGHDELDHLARSFDSSAAALQAQELRLLEVNAELLRVNRSLRVLSAGNKSLLFATTEQDLLDRICRGIVEEGGYLAAWIGFTGPDRDKYLHTAASYSTTTDVAEQIDWNTVCKGLRPVINAVRNDEVLVINDTSAEMVTPRLGEQAAKFGYRSVIILPLHLEGKPFGALILTAREKNEFRGLQVEYLKETAADTSFGIDLWRTRGDRNRLMLMEGHHELVLRNALEEALRAIAMTIEMRDPYTAGHQRRVGDLAKALATDLGLGAEEAHGIYLAAIVHDIGKIGIPAEILVKPARLSEIEYAMVKGHAAIGYEILKGVNFPWPIAEMVHQHHERMAGSGYPLGLHDSDITFGARILTVADVVEAMSSHRPYRPQVGLEAALREIEKGRGTRFDAAVVDACLKLFRKDGFMFQ